MLEENKMRFKSTRVFSRENGIIFAFLLLILSIFILSTSNAAARAPESTRLTAPLVPIQSTSPLVINEIDYDQPSTDAAEYIELKNVSGAALDLDPYQVELVNASGPVVYLVVDLPAFTLPNGDYYVICANTATVPNCDLDISPDTNLIQNGAPDAVAITLGGSVIETVSYEGDTAAPYTEGSGVGLIDSGVDINGGISRFPDGTDSDQNNIDLSFRCNTPGAANTADNAFCDGTPTPTNTPDGSTPTPTATPSITPTPTATPAGPTPTPIQAGSPLVINEVDYDQSGTDMAEFVELKNVSGSAVDLSEYTVELVNGFDGLPYLTYAMPAFSLPAGDYYVICADATMVANCDLDVTPDTNLIQNGAPDAVAIRWLNNNQVFDTVSYEGDTAAPYTEGSGIGLEDNSALPLLGISRFPDGADTHQNNVDLSPRCTTPGGANTAENTNCDGSATPTPTPTNTPEPTPTSTPAPATARIYLSSDTAGTIGPLTFGTEDVILFDQGGGFWAMLFDGSDVGLANTARIDALIFLASGRLIMSFADTTTIPNIGPIASADLVLFVPTSLGNNTAGNFAFIFDGSDVGLDTAGENVDALALAPSGALLISTTDSFAVTGGVTGEDEDLIAFIPTNFGQNTTGSWQLYFDGSDVGFDQSPNQDISAAWVNLSNIDIYLSPLGPVGPISGDDIIVCTPGSLGNNTSCLNLTFFWNGAGSGLVGNINALDLRFTNSPVLEPLGLEP